MFNEFKVYKDYLKGKKTKKTDVEYMDLEDDDSQVLEDKNMQGQQQQNRQQAEEPLHTVRRSTKVSKPPERFTPSLYHLLVTVYRFWRAGEAMKDNSKKKWDKSMKEEIDSLLQNQTWDLVHLRAGKRALQNKWVFRLKEEECGGKRYKSRLVVKGFEQKKGIDFDEIFSPVVKMNSIKSL